MQEEDVIAIRRECWCQGRVQGSIGSSGEGCANIHHGAGDGGSAQSLPQESHLPAAVAYDDMYVNSDA